MLDGAQLVIGSINDLEGEVREDIHFLEENGFSEPTTKTVNYTTEVPTASSF